MEQVVSLTKKWGNSHRSPYWQYYSSTGEWSFCEYNPNENLTKPGAYAIGANESTGTSAASFSPTNIWVRESYRSVDKSNTNSTWGRTVNNSYIMFQNDHTTVGLSADFATSDYIFSPAFYSPTINCGHVNREPTKHGFVPGWGEPSTYAFDMITTNGANDDCQAISNMSFSPNYGRETTPSFSIFVNP